MKLHRTATVTPPLRARTMTVADLDAVLAIEATAYSFPWSRGNFVDSLAAGYHAELREDADGRLVGYFVAMPGLDEMHLLNLTVAPAWQRQGHGAALLERLCALARARGDAQLWLEVRRGNDAARRLYLARGFAEVGVRRGYYPAGHGQREDAIVMSRSLREPDDALV